MPTLVFIIFLILVVGAVLYGTRTLPRNCPFFRRGGGGPGRGQAPHTQQYARLDGGAFYGDEEDYRGMEPSYAAGKRKSLDGASSLSRGFGPLRGADGDGSNDIIMEMQEKLRGGAASSSANGAALSPLPSKNSLKTMRKVKLGPVTAVSPFGGARGGDETSAATVASSRGAAPKNEGSPSRSIPKEDWGWSNEEEDL